MDFVFWLHSWWRWIVLILGLITIVKTLIGWLGKQSWAAIDRKLGSFFVISFDIQTLLGLIVYVGSMMSLHTLRWYDGSGMRLLMEHILMMTISLAVLHISFSRAKKGQNPQTQHRTLAIGAIIAFLLILVAVPVWGSSATL